MAIYARAKEVLVDPPHFGASVVGLFNCDWRKQCISSLRLYTFLG